MPTSMTRRAFVGSAGVAAAGLVAASGTQIAQAAGDTAADPVVAQYPNPKFTFTNTSDAAGDILIYCDNVETDTEGEWTGVGWSWMTKPETPADSEVSEEVDCEILVMGLGSAGVPATVYAAAMGADVVAVTADDFPEAEGAYVGAYNSRHDSEYGITYDLVALMADFSLWGQGQDDGQVTGTIVDRSGDAVEWFANYCDDVFPHELGTDAVVTEGIHINTTATHFLYTWPDPEETHEQWRVYHGFPKLLKAACDKAAANGARIYYSTPGKQLIKDESGRVVGAFCQKSDGSYLKVNASKGVLLATGDFHHNPEMCAAFVPVMPADMMSRAPYGHNMGDGIKMAWWIGAQQDKGPFNLGICWPHDFEFKAFSPSRWGSKPFLRVNIAGYRYVNETLGAHEAFSTSPMCLADMKQPGHTGYQLCDSKYAEILGEDDARIFDDCVERGVIYKANTLEELSQIVGFTNQDRLIETVEHYNEMCAAGADVDYGVPAEYLPSTCLTEPPFYCMPRVVYKQWTNGGIFVNRFGQVFSEDREPIAGLYAAGNIRAGLASTHYLWKYDGSNKMNAVTGGMLCVKHMLGTWDEKFVTE